MVPDFANHYAFLVGIDEYEHHDLPDLHGACSDAVVIRDTLVRIGYREENIRVVVGAATTRSGLRSAVWEFCELVDACDKGAEIVTFWAGHGSRSTRGEGFLIVRDTDPAKGLAGEALSLGWLAGKLTGLGQGPVTMFFDVCHSALHEAEGLSRADALDSFHRAAGGATFVGVATFAWEHWTHWHPHRASRRGGILAEALRVVLAGEPYSHDDPQPEADDDLEFVVTDRTAVGRLSRIVRREAAASGVREVVHVLADRSRFHDGPVGFARRKYRLSRLGKLSLPAAADKLARTIVERDVGVDHTGFGDVVADLDRLIAGATGVDSYVQGERRAAYRAVLALRGSRHLAVFVWFLLFCRENVTLDAEAGAVVDALHDHLLDGRPEQELAEGLIGPYRKFALRGALPWSCGIVAIDEDGRQGYAPIVGVGESVADEQVRCFWTTDPEQSHAHLEILRTNGNSIRRQYITFAWLKGPCRPGSVVRVRLAPDVNGCRKSEDRSHCDEAGVSIPMRVQVDVDGHGETTGDVEDGAHPGYHWHLVLDDDWLPSCDVECPPAVGPWRRLTLLVDECIVLLEDLLVDEAPDSAPGRGDDMHAIVNRLFQVDVAIRLRDETRIRAFVDDLVKGWRGQATSSTERVLGRLLHAIDQPTGTVGADPADVPDVLAAHDRWKAEPARANAPKREMEEAELLALILSAVSAQDEVDARIAELTEFVLRASVADPADALNSVVLAGGEETTARVVDAARDIIATATVAIESADSDLPPEDRELLEEWRAMALGALARGRPHDALRGFLEHFSQRRRTGASLIVGTLVGRGVELDETVRDLDLLTHDVSQSEQTSRAAEIYGALTEYAQEHPDLLLLMAGLSQPESSREYVLTVLATAVDGPLALRGLTVTTDDSIAAQEEVRRVIRLGGRRLEYVRATSGPDGATASPDSVARANWLAEHDLRFVTDRHGRTWTEGPASVRDEVGPGGVGSDRAGAGRRRKPSGHRIPHDSPEGDGEPAPDAGDSGDQPSSFVPPDGMDARMLRARPGEPFVRLA